VEQTYTVDFDRDGSPKLGHIIGRLVSNDHRFVANHGDTITLSQLSNGLKEPIGRQGLVKSDKTGKNLFVFHKESQL